MKVTPREEDVSESLEAEVLGEENAELSSAISSSSSAEPARKRPLDVLEETGDAKRTRESPAEDAISSSERRPEEAEVLEEDEGGADEFLLDEDDDIQEIEDEEVSLRGRREWLQSDYAEEVGVEEEEPGQDDGVQVEDETEREAASVVEVDTAAPAVERVPRTPIVYNANPDEQCSSR